MLPATVYVTEPLGGETVVDDLHVGDRVIKALSAPNDRPASATSPSASRLDPQRLHVFAEDGAALLSAAGSDTFEVRVTPA